MCHTTALKSAANLPSCGSFAQFRITLEILRNYLLHYSCINRRVAEIQIFEKTYLIVIKDETGLRFKINDSNLFLIGSYAQKLVASY